MDMIDRLARVGVIVDYKPISQFDYIIIVRDLVRGKHHPAYKPDLANPHIAHPLYMDAGHYYDMDGRLRIYVVERNDVAILKYNRTRNFPIYYFTK